MKLLLLLGAGAVHTGTDGFSDPFRPGGLSGAGGSLLGFVAVLAGVAVALTLMYYGAILAGALVQFVLGTIPGRIGLGVVAAAILAFAVFNVTSNATSKQVVAATASPGAEESPDVRELSLKQTVDVFYRLVRTHQLRFAHMLLSDRFRDDLPYEKFRDGYADVTDLRWELDEVQRDMVGARVTASVGDDPRVFSHVMWHGTHDDLQKRWILDEADPVRD